MLSKWYLHFVFVLNVFCSGPIAKSYMLILCVCVRDRQTETERLALALSFVSVCHNSDFLFPLVAAFGKKKSKILQLTTAFTYTQFLVCFRGSGKYPPRREISKTVL